MSAVQDRPQMNYFLMRFRRTKPDESEISFVAACEEKWSPGGPKNWSKIFAHKFQTSCFKPWKKLAVTFLTLGVLLDRFGGVRKVEDCNGNHTFGRCFGRSDLR